MTPLVALAARSAWNRRFALSLVVASIALSTLLLLGIERLRKDVRETFSQSVSGTDLIVGARGGSVQLLLYSVFRIGAATQNVSSKSVQAIAGHRAVAWVVPVSLGDSHRGFPVVGTSPAYFEHFRHGERRALAFAQGRPFGAVYEAVLGAEVAGRLGYRLGDRLVLSHGDGALAENDHADQPFVVVGILRRTGTPVDRSVHVGLDGMQAIHSGGPAAALVPNDAVTAVLVGLKSRAAVFSVQRWVSDYAGEPLLAVLPGVALDELWEVVGLAERALLAMGALVLAVSLAGMVAVILAGLNERRRELAILRAVGAGPRPILLLLATEGAIVTLLGVALGAVAAWAAVLALGGWIETHYGIVLRLRPPQAEEWRLMGAMLAAGWLAGLVPGYRAYRLSLADGISPRI